MLLREWPVQPPSPQKEKFDPPDIGWQRPCVQRIRIGKIRVAAEQSLDHGRDEATFKQVRRLRLFQRQSRKEGKVDAAIRAGSRVERVDDMVGFAESKWQPDHQIGSDVADDILRNRLRVGKQFRHEHSVWRATNRNSRSPPPRIEKNRASRREAITLPRWCSM